MTQRILFMAVAASLFLGSSSFAQDKKESPASASDISVDQIKKASAKQEKGDAKTKDAKATDAKATDAKKTDAKKADDKKDAPKPVMEGTAVAQPDCKESGGCDKCDPCKKRCRGRLMGRLRGRFGRRCCG